MIAIAHLPKDFSFEMSSLNDGMHTDQQMRGLSLTLQNLNNSPVGVVGGGQLAQMLVEAARCRKVKIIVQSESIDDPAVSKATDHVLAQANDALGTGKLFRDCRSVTFENEWVNIAALLEIENQGGCFIPPLQALEPLLNKISQRNLLDDLEIPSPNWIDLCSNQIGPSKLPIGWNFPLMAKSSRGGYDGKGTKVLRNFDDLNKLLEVVDPNEWLIEEWIPYEKELALVASRDFDGCVRTFPLVETHQFQQVCDWVIAPADVTHPVHVMAYNIAASLLTELNYVGVLAIEFFYGTKGLLVNEVAPRTHNSGHFSIEACNSSQFDQQLCIAAGLPVLEPELKVPGALMVNLLGLPEDPNLLLEDRLSNLKRIDGAFLHWYEKTNEIPGRKLGHVTLLLSGEDAKTRREEANRGLEIIRSIWPIHGVNIV